MRCQLLDREGDHAAARPQFALMDDTDGLVEVLDGGALREYSPDAGLERMHGPGFVAIGFYQDHPWPDPALTELAAYAESVLDVRIDQNDMRRAGTHESVDGRRGGLCYYLE